MTHPNAEILRAIAEGKEVQWKNTNASGKWHDLYLVGRREEAAIICLLQGADHLQWRIKPEKKTGWINVYVSEHIATSRHAIIWDTKQEADKNADHNSRIACIQITYEEGEGL